MKTVLLPTDLTLTSDLALRYAIALSAQLDATLEVLHVDPKMELSVARPVRHWARGPDEDLQSEDWKSWQKEVIRQVVSSGKEIPVRFVEKQGAPAAEIKAHQKKSAPSWIVMGTKSGTKAQPHQPLGSVAISVLSEANAPVLLVPHETEPAPIRQVAYATDFEEQDLSSVLKAHSFLQDLEGCLTCVHVRDKDTFWDQTQQDFFDGLYQLSENSPRINFKILTDSQVMEALEKFITSEEIDALALLHRHHHDLREFYLKSLTRRLAIRSKIPLIIFRE